MSVPSHIFLYLVYSCFWELILINHIEYIIIVVNKKKEAPMEKIEREVLNNEQ